MKRTTFVLSVNLIIAVILILTGAKAHSAGKISVLNTGPEAGHYLQWNNKPILLIGDSVTQGWMEGGTNFDSRAYVDALSSRGINLIMIWSYIGTSAANQKSDSRIGYDAPEVWPWGGSPDQGNLDLTKFNQTYFDRLKELVSYAESKGIVVLITVHDGWTKDRFGDHPFNSANGNGPISSNTQYVELADYANELPATYNTSWTRQQKNQYFQERFCDRLITELEPYTNVIFEMFNEGEWYDQTLRNQHEQHFLSFFRKRTNALLLTNTDHISFDNPHNDSMVDIVTLHGSPWTGYFDVYESAYNTTPPKHYLRSEPVPGWKGDFSVADIRRSAWEQAVAGASWVAQNDTSFGWDANSAIASKGAARDQAYDYIGYVASFFNESNVGFSSMRPNGNACSTGVCMANDGAEYVVYAYNGGSLTVNLSAAGGSTLSTRWYNPRTGQFTPDAPVVGGGTASFTAPDSNDWVLHIGGTPSDTTASPKPQGLVATPLGSTQIALSWSPSSDPESGVSKYNVYRNGSLVGQTAATSYTDSGLTESTSYIYEVSAINGAGLESAKSFQVSATTMADTAPPTIVSASSSGDPNTVTVVFNEGLDPVSSTNPSNFQISGGVIVSAAALEADEKTVTLTTSTHSEGIIYTLAVSNVKDDAAVPNTIAVGSSTDYTYTAQLQVSNLTVATGKTYLVVDGGLTIGATMYLDRGYTFTTVPASVSGATFIQTANDDKSSTGSSFLSFDTNQSVSVFVAYDDRNFPVPAWMAEFTDTGTDLVSSDTTLSMFKQDFPAGTVSLGGNEGSAGSMYIVIMKPVATVLDTVPPSPPTVLTTQ